MDWTQMLDSLVDHFTDHHDAQVLNNAAVQRNEWLHDDKLWLRQQPIPDHKEAKTPPKNWDVSANPYRLTQDKMPQIKEVPAVQVPVIQSDTPYNLGGDWNRLETQKEDFLPTFSIK